MSILIGKDDPDDLYLLVYYTSIKYDDGNHHIDQFKKDFKNYKYMNSYFLQQFFDKTHNNGRKYPKNSDYNLESCILDYVRTEPESRKMINEDNLVAFILKNKRWYYCSENTDMLLIPLE